MSRKIIALVILGYFAAAVILAIVIEATNPFAKFDGLMLARALGAGAALFVVSGIVPLIIFSNAALRSPAGFWSFSIVGVNYNYNRYIFSCWK